MAGGVSAGGGQAADLVFRLAGAGRLERHAGDLLGNGEEIRNALGLKVGAADRGHADGRLLHRRFALLGGYYDLL
jgi:hypothetical protein